MGFSNPFKRNRSGGASIPAVFVSSSGGDSGSQTDGTAFAALDLIASSVASLSGSFFGAASRRKVESHPLYWVLNHPNAEETKFQFMYQSVQDYFRHGNIYWYRSDNGEGEIASLFRLAPPSVSVGRGSDGRKTFASDGKAYPPGKILHIPSRFGYDGLSGKSIFSECRSVFQTAKEIDVYVNNVFNNNVGHRLIIDISKEFPNATQAQIEELKQQFSQGYAGLQNAGKPLVKAGKIEFGKIDTEAKDNRASQLLENRQHQEKEIAKLFGIPQPLLSASGDGADIEALYILFIENAIRPVATQLEQGVNRLLPPVQRSSMFFEYGYGSLLKTNLAARMDAYAKQLANGILSVNEVRRRENLPEVEAGNDNFIPANLMPLREDVLEAYMAGAKLKLKQLNNKQLNSDSPGAAGSHSAAGDDKT